MLQAEMTGSWEVILEIMEALAARKAKKETRERMILAPAAYEDSHITGAQVLYEPSQNSGHNQPTHVF